MIGSRLSPTEWVAKARSGEGTPQPGYSPQSQWAEGWVRPPGTAAERRPTGRPGADRAGGCAAAGRCRRIGRTIARAGCSAGPAGLPRRPPRCRGERPVTACHRRRRRRVPGRGLRPRRCRHRWTAHRSCSPSCPRDRGGPRMPLTLDDAPALSKNCRMIDFHIAFENPDIGCSSDFAEQPIPGPDPVRAIVGRGGGGGWVAVVPRPAPRGHCRDHRRTGRVRRRAGRTPPGGRPAGDFRAPTGILKELQRFALTRWNIRREKSYYLSVTAG